MLYYNNEYFKTISFVQEYDIHKLLYIVGLTLTEKKVNFLHTFCIFSFILLKRISIPILFSVSISAYVLVGINNFKLNIIILFEEIQRNRILR